MKKCPHCDKDLRLASETHKETPKGVTETQKWKCPVDNCKYQFTQSIVTEDAD